MNATDELNNQTANPNKDRQRVQTFRKDRLEAHERVINSLLSRVKLLEEKLLKLEQSKDP